MTNTSVNPARSAGPALALLMGGYDQALNQLWLFWVAPILGAIVGALAYKAVGWQGGLIGDLGVSPHPDRESQPFPVRNPSSSPGSVASRPSPDRPSPGWCRHSH